MEDNEDIFKSLKVLVPNPDDQLNLCATMFGISGHLAMFIFERWDFIVVPDDIKYCMGLMSMNMYALQKGEKGRPAPDLGLENLPSKEKLLKILRMFIETYKDEL